MTQPSQGDFFAGGGESLKWPSDVVNGHFHDQRLINVWRGGRIVSEPKIMNQTDPKTKQVRTWDDGTPRKQLVVGLMCDGSRQGIVNERNSQNPQDYGVRSLFIKTGLRTAVQAELQRQNLQGLAVGGELYVAWTGEAPTEYGKPARVWEAKYFPPQPGEVALPADGPTTTAQATQAVYAEVARQQGQPHWEQPSTPSAPPNPWGPAPGAPQQAPAPQPPTQPPAFQQPAAPAANPWGNPPQQPPAAPPAQNPWGPPTGAPPTQQQPPAAPPNPWG